MALTRSRMLDAEHPLDCPWGDFLQPSGHSCRASADWLDAFVGQKIDEENDPLFIGAASLALSDITPQLAFSLFKRACKARPECAMILDGSDGSLRALQRTEHFFLSLRDDWSVPLARGWAASLTDSEVLRAAQERFLHLASSLSRLAERGAFAYLLSTSGLLPPAIPTHLSSDQDMNMRGARAALLSFAMGHGCPIPAAFQIAEQNLAAARACHLLAPSALLWICNALAQDPEERARLAAQAINMACSILSREKNWMDSERKNGRYTNEDAQRREAFEFGLRNLAASTCSVATGLAENHSRPQAELLFWETLLGKDWNSPAASGPLFEFFHAWPYNRRLGFALALPDASGRLAGKSLVGARHPAAAAWDLLAHQMKPNPRTPIFHCRLAQAYPWPEMEALSFARCPAPLKAAIERNALAGFIPELTQEPHAPKQRL